MKAERTFVIYPYADGTLHISGGGTEYVHTWNKQTKTFDISGGKPSSDARYNPAKGEFVRDFTYQHVADYVKPRLADIVRLMAGRKASKAIGMDFYADGKIDVLENLREVVVYGISEYFVGKRYIGSIA